MVAVFFVDNEVEAELARGRLESEGIPAQVRFSARAGYPRYVAGYGGFGIGAPLSTYEVLVAEERADEARGILHVPEREPSHSGPWRIWLIRAIAIAFVAPLLYAAWQWLRLLF